MGMWGRNTCIPPVTSKQAFSLIISVAGIWILMFRPFLQLPEPRVNLVIDVSALFLPLCCSFHSLRMDHGVQEFEDCSCRFLHERHHLQQIERINLKCLCVQFRLRCRVRFRLLVVSCSSELCDFFPSGHMILNSGQSLFR